MAKTRIKTNFWDDLNALRVSMDEKIDSMKEEIMLQVQEKIDQALTEIDDNTDRADQIDSVKSNIQGMAPILWGYIWPYIRMNEFILVEIMVLKSELEEQIRNQTTTIASDIEKIIGKGLVDLQPFTTGPITFHLTKKSIE